MRLGYELSVWGELLSGIIFLYSKISGILKEKW